MPVCAGDYVCVCVRVCAYNSLHGQDFAFYKYCNYYHCYVGDTVLKFVASAYPSVRTGKHARLSRAEVRLIRVEFFK